MSAEVLFLSGAGWEPFHEWLIWRFLFDGLRLSAEIAGYSIALSLVIGVATSVMRLAPLRPLRWIAGTYIEVFRAAPVLLLLFFVFFGAGRVNLDLGPKSSAVIALTLYNSAVIAEVMRAGILSIPRGIVEASRALGLSYLQSMRFVAVPMALRRMAPGIVSQLITLFKDTSLASLLGLIELTRSGRIIYENPKYGNILEVLTVIAVMYFIPCYALSLIARRLERSPDAAKVQAAAEVVGGG